VTLSPPGVDIPLAGGPAALDATVSIMPSLAEMPEPGTLVLAALGAAGLLARRRLAPRPADCD
jgi:uncharacterized protein (TIGR03382 family)